MVADLNAIANAESVRANGESYSAFRGRMELHFAGEKEKALDAEKKCGDGST